MSAAELRKKKSDGSICDVTVFSNPAVQADVVYYDAS